MALADEMPVSEAVRAAIADRIEQRRQDADFQERLHRAIERNQRALELLAK
jgi:hypothetical protein